MFVQTICGEKQKNQEKIVFCLREKNPKKGKFGKKAIKETK